MNAKQQALFDLLVKVKKFLDDEGIVFYLFGGSAIGALRHGGFIPWDDDIDILMDRENYHKLLSKENSLPWDDIELNHEETNPNFFKPFAMFSTKKDTWTSRGRMFWGGVCMGTTLDVMVVDDVPSDRMEEHMKNLLLYEECVSETRTYHRDYIVKYKDEFFACDKRRKEIGREALIKELRDRLEQFSPEESDKKVVRCWGRKLRDYDKEWIAEPTYHTFEGVMMPLPTHPEATLRLQYGYDWYMVPRKDDWEMHDHAIFNPGVSYNNYYEDIKEYLDEDEILELQRERKKAFVEWLDKRQTIRDYSGYFMSRKIMMETGISERTEELKKLFREGKYEQFNSELQVLLQNAVTFMKCTDSAELVDQELVADWMYSLIYAGRYFDARRALNLFGDLNAGNEKLARAAEFMEKVYSIAEVYQDREYEELRRKIDEMPEDVRDDIADCILGRMRICLDNEGSEEEMKALLDQADEYLKVFPHNYDVKKASGDILMKLGRNDEAMKNYREVYKYSHNGLDLHELETRFSDIFS